MRQIKVIIGASYGDEGKGLAADFFAAEAARSGLLYAEGGIVTVLTNGGPQRGHTVELPDGRRHVFKHFGAGTFRGGATYFSSLYLVNPMQFVREYCELQEMGCKPAAFVHPGCRFTTPYDVLANQMLQSKRGNHTSCGFGIWETVLRYSRGRGMPFGEFLKLNPEGKAAYLRGIRDSYYAGTAALTGRDAAAAGRLSECGLQGSDIWDIFFDEGILLHFLADCEEMRRLCPAAEESVLKIFGTVLFENAQGLLLDGNRKGEEEFTTPSTTGMGQVFPMIERNFKGEQVEVCYVTRSYLTRHGDGPMEGELATGTSVAVSSAAVPAPLLRGLQKDRTNPANRFQGALRYGIINETGTLAERIGEDFSICEGTGNNLYRSSVMVTHLNEFAGIDTGLLAERFGTVYLSDGRTDRDVNRTEMQRKELKND